jgi:hypothetical protein
VQPLGAQGGVVAVTRIDNRRVAVDVEDAVSDIAEKLLEITLLPGLADPAGEQRRT